MSENKKVPNVCIGPFGTLKTYEGQSDFDKYYFDVTEKDVFKPSGELDPETGEQLGVIEKKVISKKIDIHELLESQRDNVGVESYMKALALQGESLDEFNTVVDDKINDFSDLPNSLADVMTAGDKAKIAFANLDPVLKDGHTTIEGFLNSLTQDKIDAFIKARVEALTPKSEVKGD